MLMEPYYLNLDALLEADLTSYEYYVSLSPAQKKKLQNDDIHTFAQLQDAAAADSES